MNDCTNLEMRDLLPDLARGVLTGSPLAAVQDHLAACASCRAELILLRNAHAVLAATPAVDTARISAAVVRSRPIRRGPRQRVWLAAASIVAFVGAALLATSIARRPGESEMPPVVIELDAPDPTPPDQAEPAVAVRSTPPQPGRAELVVGGGVSDLADADLESLLRALDGLDAQLDAEPAPLLPLLEGEV